MSTNSVLIIDDEERLRKLLGRIVSLEGYHVLQAGSLKEGLDVLKRKEISVLLCDVKLPDGNGVDFVKEVKAACPATEIILLTAYGNISDGVQAIKNGAFDYITKGNDNDKIIPLLAQAMEKAVSTKDDAIKHDIHSTSFSFIIGSSNAIKQTIDLAKRISPTNANVLLLGETGTGKEVFARAIHSESRQNEKPFVAINCSAFSKELLEGELFGHKAGAYTGATKDKKGLIETADGGTLFLDEIGELNLDLQAKLLRVLETGEFIKLGDIKTTRVTVRIIAATNRDLQKEVNEGHFRQDLFYRLNTFTLSLPPLRERKEDVKELANHFRKTFSAREGKVVTDISTDAMRALVAHSWKGNIRELRNVMERAVILAEGASIQVHDLPTDVQHPQPAPPGFLLADVEKAHIQKILAHSGGNKTKTASLLGIGLATLYRKLDEYGLTR
jgi:two-component system, NtrC family, response regulator